MSESQQYIPEEDIEFLKEKIQNSKQELHKRIKGMDRSIESILLGLISRGHILMEGMPGLAKTMLAKSISEIIDQPFQRIQFTPDLLPADLTGTLVYNPKTSSFDTRKGPVFTGVLLADEVNRAPAKVQSALLQCMEERSVTLGDKTHPLDENFFVVATQNPIDQEGTYNLPEAQMDRFLLKLKVDYPDKEDELAIIDQHGRRDETKISKVVSTKDLNRLVGIAESVFVDEKLKEYIISIVRESRPKTASISNSKKYIRYGASPRACLALIRIARGKALFDGRDFVIPEDIQLYAKEVLRHRILLNYEALSEDIDTDTVIDSLLESVRVP